VGVSDGLDDPGRDVALVAVGGLDDPVLEAGATRQFGSEDTKCGGSAGEPSSKRILKVNIRPLRFSAGTERQREPNAADNPLGAGSSSAGPRVVAAISGQSGPYGATRESRQIPPPQLRSPRPLLGRGCDPRPGCRARRAASARGLGFSPRRGRSARRGSLSRPRRRSDRADSGLKRQPLKTGAARSAPLLADVIPPTRNSTTIRRAARQACRCGRRTTCGTVESR
jgi:hypothetical protein